MFDPALLSTFVSVAKAASFSEAGRRLGLRQSTVSQHIRRLEQAAGRRLFVRDTHSVRLTADGEAMLALAQGILEANERARQYFAVSELRGRLRFGASEDFVQTRLPEVLRDFTRIHRAVDLELTVGMSGALFEALDAAELDLVLAKRRPGEDRGRLVRRERLLWIAGDFGARRSRSAVAADPLSAAEHQPCDGARSPRTGRQELAHRLYQHQPDRPQCRRSGRARNSASRPKGLCRPGSRNCRDRHGCPSSGTSNSLSLAAVKPCAARHKPWQRPFSTMLIGCRVGRHKGGTGWLRILRARSRS